MYSAAAQSDLLIYLDCDFTYPAENIPVLRRLCRGGGRRRGELRPHPHAARGHAGPQLPRQPRLCRHGARDARHPDLGRAQRYARYRCSVIRAFDFDGEGDALPIDTLLFPAKCGYRVVEMPIDYNERVGT